LLLLLLLLLLFPFRDQEEEEEEEEGDRDEEEDVNITAVKKTAKGLALTIDATTFVLTTFSLFFRFFSSSRPLRESANLDCG
jgi:hypothetical protein